MIGPIVLLYAAVGIFSAVAAMLIFSPPAGFRPPWHVQLMVLLTLVCCWPALGALALWSGYCTFLAWLDASPRREEFSVGSRFHVAKPK